MRHIRAARLCARGAREWLAHHGFDAHEFIAQGIEASRLEATGDHFALTVCKLAREEAERGQQ